MDEFIPLDHFYRIMRVWWVVALATFLGGALGFVFHLFNPPFYEATATFYSTLDFSKIPKDPFTQYDEDLALATIQENLYYNNPLHEKIVATDQIRTSGLTYTEWLKNISIEREHAFWKIHVRHPNPSIAQALVDVWAKLGYEALLSAQQTGKIPEYVLFEPPNVSDLPTAPVRLGTIQLVLAGALIGFILGIMLVELVLVRVSPALRPVG